MIKRIINNIFKHESINLYESQFWSIDKLEAFQNQRLRKIIKYSYNNIPGYKNKFDKANIKPEDIKTKSDLRKIPVTTKEELLKKKDFVNEKLISNIQYSGGSTGASLEYFESEECVKIRRNSHFRGWAWGGYTPEKRRAIISSAQGVIKEKNTINLIGDLSSENLKKNVEILLEFKPQHMRGYVGSLYILAKYCLDNNIRLETIGSVNTISENLYDFQRNIIEKAFNCKIFDEYCCNDGGACAWECEAHEGLHYFMERAIIENIDGEMIVTDLWNRAMPFIRYKNGDSVKFLDKKCSCGRELPLISVKGRDNDIIISKKGIISPTFLIHHGIGIAGAGQKINKFRSGFRMIQYVQKPGYILEVNIVRNPWCKNEEIKEFKEKLSEIVNGMDTIINFVDDIPTTEKGKRSFIINDDKELLNKMISLSKSGSSSEKFRI